MTLTIMKSYKRLQRMLVSLCSVGLLFGIRLIIGLTRLLHTISVRTWNMQWCVGSQMPSLPKCRDQAFTLAQVGKLQRNWVIRLRSHTKSGSGFTMLFVLKGRQYTIRLWEEPVQLLPQFVGDSAPLVRKSTPSTTLVE